MAEQSILGARALSRIPNNGSTRAARLADIYIKTHSNAEGKVKDPAVYQQAIDMYLAPFGDNLIVQGKIASYQNEIKSLSAAQGESSETVSGLRLKEHGAWFVDEDEVDSTGFRNPAYVAQVTSESLDMLVAETVATIQAKSAAGKDTAEVEVYLNDLMKRADRMRTLSQSIQDGEKVDMDGYGYYVDTDPNTGAVRGASLMPTDAGLKEIGEGTVRTDTMVQVGNKHIPLYLPYVKDASGQYKTKFAGRDYTGDSTLLQASDDSDVVLSDRANIQTAGDTFQRGQVYRSFTGKNNIDGSPQQSYYFAGFDNKIYQFSDQDPKGKAFLNSLKSTGQVNVDSIPRISPYTAATMMATSLPTDNPQFERQTMNGMNINRRTQEAAVATAEADRMEGRSGLQAVVEGASDIAKGAFGAVAGFFSRKNKQSPPEEAPARTGEDVIDQGASFFEAVNPALKPGRTP